MDGQKQRNERLRGATKKETDPLTVYSPFELISLVFSTSRGWHKTVAQPPCRGTVHHCTEEPRKPTTDSQDTQIQADTYSNEAGQKVCEHVISHHACSQDELLGLVVTRQLKERRKWRGKICDILMVTLTIWADYYSPTTWICSVFYLCQRKPPANLASSFKVPL